MVPVLSCVLASVSGISIHSAGLSQSKSPTRSESFVNNHLLMSLSKDWKKIFHVLQQKRTRLQLTI